MKCSRLTFQICFLPDIRRIQTVIVLSIDAVVQSLYTVLFACYQLGPILIQTTMTHPILVLPPWHWLPMKYIQGWHGEGHNWDPDVGRDLLGGDSLWQGGGSGVGGHTGFS